MNLIYCLFHLQAERDYELYMSSFPPASRTGLGTVYIVFSTCKQNEIMNLIYRLSACQQNEIMNVICHLFHLQVERDYELDISSFPLASRTWYIVFSNCKQNEIINLMYRLFSLPKERDYELDISSFPPASRTILWTWYIAFSICK